MDYLISLILIKYINKIYLFNILVNLPSLFNGKITYRKFVHNYKTSHIEIKVLDTENTYIQADGEIIGSGNFSVLLLEEALSFIIP